MENVLISELKNDYVANAVDAVTIKFVDSLEGLEEEFGHHPDFVHQHFGEQEKIVGYKNLSVTICYSDVSLFIYPIIEYESQISKYENIAADDIAFKIRDALPSSQLDALITDVTKFDKILKEQHHFKPPGNLVLSYTIDSESNAARSFHLYKVDTNEDKYANCYLERAQSLAFWYIDAVAYTDYNDPRFFNYFLFEYCMWENGLPRYIFTGYATLYRFYCYPEKERIRIAHLMLCPTYIGCGIGAQFLSAIYSDLRSKPNIYDITAETPADNFIYMRDFVDCVDCSQLLAFKKENLLKGFSKEMKEEAQNKLKLHKLQARRVYEILRLLNTNMKNKNDAEAYKTNVMNRLKKPYVRSKRDFRRLSKALNPKELAIVAQSADQQEHIRIQYEQEIEGYKIVIRRLKLHKSKIFN